MCSSYLHCRWADLEELEKDKRIHQKVKRFKAKQALNNFLTEVSDLHFLLCRHFLFLLLVVVSQFSGCAADGGCGRRKFIMPHEGSKTTHFMIPVFRFFTLKELFGLKPCVGRVWESPLLKWCTCAAVSLLATLAL